MHMCVETGSVFLEHFQPSNQERHKGSTCVRRYGSRREKCIELVCQALVDHDSFQVNFTGITVLTSPGMAKTT